MARAALLRITLVLVALLTWGTGQSYAKDVVDPANIFAEIPRPADREPRPHARAHRSILLKTSSWERDILDDELPWLDVDLMIEVGDVSSYFEGVEVQYEMRKALAAAPCTDTDCEIEKKSYWQGAYEAALRTAKEKIVADDRRNASHWKPVKFDSPGDYVAVFDADETLLNQWFNPPNADRFDWWFDDGLKDVPSDNVGEKKSGHRVRFAPGAEEALIRLKADSHCKAIVLFSAKDDDALQYIYDRWKSRRQDKVVSMPDEKGTRLIDAVFSRSHLTMSGDPNFGGVARIPSKNLRIFDPKLEHVVIVDDNPARILPEQQFLLRAQPKFDSGRFMKSESERNASAPRFWKYYTSILKQTVDEIEESSRRAEGDKRFARIPYYGKGRPPKMPFFQAFRPYSFLGRRVWEGLKYSIPREDDDLGSMLFRATGLKPRLEGEKLEREALEAARLHLELYDAAFDSL